MIPFPPPIGQLSHQQINLNSYDAEIVGINLKTILIKRMNYNFSIIDKGKDSLECFLKEGLHIKNKSPAINGKFNNGFII